MTAKGKKFQNPILPYGHADPWLVYTGGQYFYIHSKDNSISVRKSRTLGELKNAEDITVWNAPESGNYSKEIWAPELHYLKGQWYIYFSADDGNNPNHRMYVLEGGSNRKNPLEDIFKFKGKIGDSSNKWAIDGTVFQKKNGSLYMIWSGWEGDMDGRQNLYIAAMDNPWTITGERILISQPTESWETVAMPINEGPAVLYFEDSIFIVYSASGSWTEDYCLGMLTNRDGDVLNPSSWVKNPQPIFKKSVENSVYGVGHCCFIKSPKKNEDWIIYHGMDNPAGGWGGRSSRAQKFSWNKDNTPNFGIPVSNQALISEPKNYNKLLRFIIH